MRQDRKSVQLQIGNDSTGFFIKNSAKAPEKESTEPTDQYFTVAAEKQFTREFDNRTETDDGEPSDQNTRNSEEPTTTMGQSWWLHRQGR